MPSSEPIKLYLESVEAYRRGDRETAARKLAQSLGASEPSDVIRNSIDKLLATDTMPNEAALKIMATEVAKGKAL